MGVRPVAKNAEFVQLRPPGAVDKLNPEGVLDHRAVCARAVRAGEPTSRSDGRDRESGCGQRLSRVVDYQAFRGADDGNRTRVFSLGSEAWLMMM